MITTPRELAEAFSGHRFRETYDRLAPDVVWVLVGATTIEGKDAVVAACEHSLAELAGITTEFSRFVSVGDDRLAVVDAIGRYTGSDGAVSTVSSCDLYEFTGDQVTMITSYTVELGSGGDETPTDEVPTEPAAAG